MEDVKTLLNVSAPIQLSEEAVKAASEGRGEQVLREAGPVRLTEDEVSAAAQGKGEQVFRKYHEKIQRK